MEEAKARMRQITWATRGQEAQLIIYIGDQKYGVFVDPENRASVLRQVGLCAADPNTNMSWEDAAEITATIRDLVPVEPTTLETTPETSDVGLLFCMVLPGVLFWGVLIPVLWIVLS